MPVTAALGIEQGHLNPGDALALLGIGSGINVVMMAVDWQTSPLANEQTDSTDSLATQPVE